MSYTNGTCALQMPSKYALMDEEEMTYVEGGGAWITRELMYCCIVLDKAGCAAAARTCAVIGDHVDFVSQWTSLLGGYSDIADALFWAIGQYVSVYKTFFQNCASWYHGAKYESQNIPLAGSYSSWSHT